MLYDKDSKGISYSAGFFMLIGFAVAGIFFASLISIPVWQSMTGLSALKMEEGMLDPKNSNAVKIIQCIQAVFGFLVPAILTAVVLNRRPAKLLGFTGKISLMQIAVVCAIMFAGLFVSGFFSFVNQHIPISDSLRQKFMEMEKNYDRQVQAILQIKTAKDYLVGLFVIAFVPALCEEALFRGGLQNYLSRWIKRPWLSIVIVSILFSALHISYFGFLSRLFLGIMLGLLFEYSGKLWLNIIAHFFNNAFAVTMIYISTLQGKPLKDAIEDNSSTWWGVFAIPVVIGLFIYFKKIASKPSEDLTGKNEELRDTPFY